MLVMVILYANYLQRYDSGVEVEDLDQPHAAGMCTTEIWFAAQYTFIRPGDHF